MLRLGYHLYTSRAIHFNSGVENSVCIMYSFSVQLCDCTNTELVSKDVKAIQTKLETHIVDTQVAIPCEDQTIQVDSGELNTPDNLKKCVSLGVQILPHINIPNALVVQRIVEFSINQRGDTELFYKSDESNVLFLEVTPSEETILIDDVDYELIGDKPTIFNIKQQIREVNGIFNDSDNPKNHIQNFLDECTEYNSYLSEHER